MIPGVTGLLSMYDAAFPPPDPPGTDAVMIYIGGDTPHVWTDAEIAAQKARFRLPMFVRSQAPWDPVADAGEIIRWLTAHHVPRGRAAGVDLETAVNAAYVYTLNELVTAAGWRLVEYGSEGYIHLDPATSGGRFTAHYTGVPVLDPDAVATQYTDDTMLGTPWDLSVYDPALLPLWDTRPPAAAAVTGRGDDTMVILSMGKPTPVALPDGAKSLRFTTVFGEVGVFPPAELSVNFHTLSAPVAVKADPGQPFPVVPVPAGCGAVTVWRMDSGTHDVCVAVSS